MGREKAMKVRRRTIILYTWAGQEDFHQSARLIHYNTNQ
jgi:hypothetical protein